MSDEQQPPLTDPFRIGDVEIPNRVLLAPLAGIGNWFVRLQAKRHGAGLAVSEMVSSFGLHHRNERTLRELMRIHPDEHPVSVQLFGHDAEVMRSGAAIAAEAGRRPDRHQHGLPGAQGAQDRRRRRAAARPRARPARSPAAPPRAAACRSRSSCAPDSRPATAPASSWPCAWSRRPASPRSRFHPRAATVGHKGSPDYALTRELVERRRGAGDRLRRAEERRGGPPRLRGVGRRRGDDRPRRARQPLGLRGADRPPHRAARPRARSSPSCSGRWTAPRSTWAPSAPRRYLRKFYPWYVEPLGVGPPSSPTSCSAAPTCPRARRLIARPGWPA